MLIALTGATGFIGSYTAASLHRAGHQVRALVRSTSRVDHIRDVIDEFRYGDMQDPQTLAGLVADGVEAVIHNASDWEARQQSPLRNFEHNLFASLRLLDAAR